MHLYFDERLLTIKMDKVYRLSIDITEFPCYRISCFELEKSNRILVLYKAKIRFSEGLFKEIRIDIYKYNQDIEAFKALIIMIRKKFENRFHINKNSIFTFIVQLNNVSPEEYEFLKNLGFKYHINSNIFTCPSELFRIENIEKECYPIFVEELIQKEECKRISEIDDRNERYEKIKKMLPSYLYNSEVYLDLIILYIENIFKRNT